MAFDSWRGSRRFQPPDVEGNQASSTEERSPETPFGEEPTAHEENLKDLGTGLKVRLDTEGGKLA